MNSLPLCLSQIHDPEDQSLLLEYRSLLNSIRSTIMPEDEGIERIPINELRPEEGAHELATSEQMQPYLRFITAVMQEADSTAAVEVIRELPLRDRYVWRIASALKWGFADFDDLAITADKETLTPEDFGKVIELLRLRPMQLAILLRVLVGAEEMQRMMFEGISLAKRQP